MKPITGITCQIFTAPLFKECAAGGISSRVQKVTLIGDGVSGPFEPAPDAPAVRLVRRTFGGVEYVHAEPDLSHPSNLVELERIGSTCPWFMAGGALLNSSDSRFREATGHSYPISLHDRVEK